MKSLTVLAAIAAGSLVFASSASAQGWERSRTAVGPYGGTATFNGAGSCSGGTCSSHQSWTGPGGNSVTRDGSTSCSGGACNGTTTWTGPRGNTVSRSRRFHRY